MNISAAKAALKRLSAWDESKVRDKAEVIREAQTLETSVHIAMLVGYFAI